MAGQRKTTPPPIDRPLSKAYLREFKGWSTAFPPGMSDPASLRVMHNCLVDADLGLRIRPGLRAVLNPAHVAALAGPIIGSFEHFWYDAGVKGLLFAIKTGSAVEFRVAKWNAGTKLFDIETTSTRFSGTVTLSTDTTYIKWVQINNRVFALAETTNDDDTWVVFDVASASGVRCFQPQDIDRPAWTTADRPIVTLPDVAWFGAGAGSLTAYASRGANPAAQTPGSATLVSSTAADNAYYVGFFYTFANEIGESAPSQVAAAAVQRPTYAWEMTATDRGGTASEDAADQLVVTIPAAVWTAARAKGARECRLYVMLWTDQEAYPIQGQMIGTKTVTADGSAAANTGENWMSMHPLTVMQEALAALPSGDPFTREIHNSSTPHANANGLVAADRLIMVYNKAEDEEGARIRWSSNQQGEYTNFSAALGGGFKTLTSGNLFHPVAVKLWQNPQSVDTVTVLCEGLDGEGTAYYMSPATINTMSQNLILMGSEETTATPGTVSPFGVEVLNNALYHPLDNNIMKSTANNYNINHALMTDAIQNVWREIPLSDKRKIVSSQMDSKLFYLVRAPASMAWSDDTTSNGNQVWVCDTAAKGTWSCWDVAGTSLRKLEIEGQLFLGLTSGKGIFIFDPEADEDDVLEGTAWSKRGIAWSAETNIQGANRAHDAWAYLQQLEVTFGNFTGECEYGIRGVDVNGSKVEVRKIYRSPQEVVHDPLNRYDQTDYLRVEHTMKEWSFFWNSLEKPKRRTYGSVLFVQYRYTPASVNVGYAYGSVETFEYGRSTSQFFNGTPVPFVDTYTP